MPLRPSRVHSARELHAGDKGQPYNYPGVAAATPILRNYLLVDSILPHTRAVCMNHPRVRGGAATGAAVRGPCGVTVGAREKKKTQPCASDFACSVDAVYGKERERKVQGVHGGLRVSPSAVLAAAGRPQITRKFWFCKETREWEERAAEEPGVGCFPLGRWSWNWVATGRSGRDAWWSGWGGVFL